VIVHGDAERTIAQMPSGCVDIFVTSPPYYLLRDYGPNGQIGNEPTAEQYVQRLVQVFAEARRAIKSTGSLWLVLGDKYIGNQLRGLPWRVALALQEDGWLLRSDIIWHKPNAMPSSVRNRPTTDHEYVFFFSKSKEYFYDADAIREPHVTFSENSRMRGGRRHFGIRGGTPERGKNRGSQNLHDGRWDQAFHPLGRNKRSVWSIPLSKFRDAHFAVFPEALVQTCIAAACPPGGLVVDPFCGSGTVPLVARRMGRQFVGIDCVAKYCALARKRLKA
jgi:site-specific DNA-methyltransferase (adenine-specific)